MKIDRLQSVKCLIKKSQSLHLNLWTWSVVRLSVTFVLIHTILDQSKANLIWISIGPSGHYAASLVVFRTGVLGWRWQHYGRGLGLSSATLASVASLRLNREPYAIVLSPQNASFKNNQTSCVKMARSISKLNWLSTGLKSAESGQKLRIIWLLIKSTNLNGAIGSF